MNNITNAISVDVEDYFQVSAFENHISQKDWENLPSNVEKNVEKILELFDLYNVLGTFFVLGWIAERYPNLIRRISENGHEVASHGCFHIRATEQTPEEFSEDVKKSKAILEDIINGPIKGYRAASYSITNRNLWAHKEIEKAGYRYSSSVYPIKHDLYGIPDAPRYPYKPDGCNILEIPISTVEILGKRFPCGGGGFFRFYPYVISKSLIKNINNSEKQPCIFYFHPWEIDVSQPIQSNLNLKTKIRHYLNLDKMLPRLKMLLADFRWGRIDSIYSS